MICVGFSDILYPGDTLGENSCIVCTHLLLLYASALTLHSIHMIFTLMIFIGMFYSCHVAAPKRDLTKISAASQRFAAVVRFCKIYSHLTSHHIVVARITSENSSSFSS